MGCPVDRLCDVPFLGAFLTRKRHTTAYPNVWYRLTDESNPDSQRRYIVRYVDGNGAEHTKTLPLGSTLEDAKVYQSRLQTRKADGDPLIPCRQTVEELLDEWLDKRCHSMAASTLASYQYVIRKHLKPEFGARRLTDLSPSHVASFISRLQHEGKKAWTIRQIIKPLKQAFEMAVRDGKITSSPVTKLLRHEKPQGDQRKMRCLSGEELSKLLSATKDPMWKALFSILAYAGLRISEALALRWEDVSETSISIRRSKTKAGVREVPLPKGVRAILRAWQIKQAPGIDLIFSTPQKPLQSPREALRKLNAAEDRAGIDRYTLHELRHTYASLLISRGVDLPTIAEQMGHTNAGITLTIYAHLYNKEEGRKKVLDALDDAIGRVL